eukprot:6190960-Pleurochrysis_carterae.AAC.1
MIKREAVSRLLIMKYYLKVTNRVQLAFHRDELRASGSAYLPNLRKPTSSAASSIKGHYGHIGSLQSTIACKTKSCCGRQSSKVKASGYIVIAHKQQAMFYVRRGGH